MQSKVAEEFLVFLLLTIYLTIRLQQLNDRNRAIRHGVQGIWFRFHIQQIWGIKDYSAIYAMPIYEIWTGPAWNTRQVA
jgi:hypothetical protein